jgi:two-component system response regulator MprA
VLVADDDEQLSALIRTALRDDCDVQIVRTGRSAVDTASTSTPDLAVIDLKMPDMDGLEACRAIRAACNRLPIIILTEHTACDNVKSAFLAGATDFLGKPFSPSQLRTRVRAQILRAT